MAERSSTGGHIKQIFYEKFIKFKGNLLPKIKSYGLKLILNEIWK